MITQLYNTLHEQVNSKYLNTLLLSLLGILPSMELVTTELDHDVAVLIKRLEDFFNLTTTALVR